MNASSANEVIELYQHARLKSIYEYFLKRLNGIKKLETATGAVNSVWIDLFKVYRPKAIIRRSKEYLRSGSLSRHKQGVHTKRMSFLDDTNVKVKLLSWLRLQKPEHRSIAHVQRYLQEDLVPSVLGVTAVNVSQKTIANYKDIYYDGHEREDTVEYSREWSSRMMAYKRQMQTYEGDQQ